MKFSSVLAIALSLATVTTGFGRDIVAYWAQNDNDLPGGGFGFLSDAFPQEADLGSGQISVGGGILSETIINNNNDEVFRWIPSFAGTTVNAEDGFGAGGSISIEGGTDNANNGSFIQFAFIMTGLTDLEVSYATRGTGFGFTTHTWSYSTNGSDFVFLETFTGRNTTSWSTLELQPSLLTVLDDVETAFLRVTLDGATASNGNNRLDNITLTAIPEPSTYGMIFGVALLSVVFIRRRLSTRR